MLTPLSVMLGIEPPGLILPFTLVGTSASDNSPSPRSVSPRGAMSGRCRPELSHRSVIWAYGSQPLSPAHAIADAHLRFLQRVQTRHQRLRVTQLVEQTFEFVGRLREGLRCG